MPAERLSIVFVLHGFGEGGIERRTITLAEELLKLGHRIHTVCYRAESAFDLPSGLDVRSLDAKRILHPLRFYEHCARRLDTHLDGIRATHGLNLVFASSIHKIAVRSRYRRLIWFRHHGPWRPEQRRLRPCRLRGAHYAGVRHLAVSKDVAESLESGAGLAPGTIRVIPNPFDLEEIRRLGGKPCDVPEEPYLVHVGRFDIEQKRHDRLLRAFRASEVNGRLVLVGSGKDRERIERMVDGLGLRDRVLFAGFQKNPYPYLRRARASVLSSDFEGLPGVVVESLALGTPVASTDTTGIGDIFPDRTCAFLAPSSDDKALARAIREAWDSPPAPERLAALAEPFSVSRVAAKYLELMGEAGA